MIRREVLGTATTPDSGEIKLVRDAAGYSIYSDDRVLMASRTHGSEEAMARIACHYVAGLSRPRVCVGGLGLGFTLRAALDRLPADAEVICAELIEAIVEWHRGPLGPLANYPIEDPRVRLVVTDVIDLVRAPGEGFDAILLDVDNGPIPMTVVGNWWLYAMEGLHALHAATRPGGVMIVWSAAEDERFLRRMEQAGFVSESVKVVARTGRRKRRGRGEAHVLFVGRRAPREE